MWFYRDLFMCRSMEEPYCRRKQPTDGIHALRVAIDDDGKQQNIIKTSRKKVTCAIKSMCLCRSHRRRSADYYRPDTGYSPRRDIFTTPPVPVRKKHKGLMGLALTRLLYLLARPWGIHT